MLCNFKELVAEIVDGTHNTQTMAEVASGEKAPAGLGWEEKRSRLKLHRGYPVRFIWANQTELNLSGTTSCTRHT
jgi:hypothetical protein